MSESQSKLEPNAPLPRRSFRWDALAAMVASFVGLLALAIAGYTAYIQRQQVSAQVWPYLISTSSDSGSDYLWINKGVGPAIVKTVVVTVDGKPQRDWQAVMRALPVAPPNYGQSTFNHNVLSAGETLQWLIFKDHDQFKSFRSAARHRLHYKVCYCSTLGDCWVNDSARNDDNARLEVDKCPAVPEVRQFRG